MPVVTMDNLSGEDAETEAEIELELKNMILDERDLIDDFPPEYITDDLDEGDENTNLEVGDLLPSVQLFLSRSQKQNNELEESLKECDSLIRDADIVNRRHLSYACDDYLVRIAGDAQVDVQPMQEKLLVGLKRSDEEDDEMEVVAETLTQPMNTGIPGNSLSSSELFSAHTVLYTDDNEDVKLNIASSRLVDNFDNSETNINGYPDVLRSEIENPVNESELLERRLQEKLRQLQLTQRCKESARKEFEESAIEKENVINKVLERKRAERLKELAEEQERLQQDAWTKAERFAADQSQLEKTAEEYSQSFQVAMRRREDEMRKIKEHLEELVAEDSRRRNELIFQAATRIQATFRSYRVRKVHGNTIKTRAEQSIKRRQEERIREIDEKLASTMQEQLTIESNKLNSAILLTEDRAGVCSAKHEDRQIFVDAMLRSENLKLNELRNTEEQFLGNRDDFAEELSGSGRGKQEKKMNEEKERLRQEQKQKQELVKKEEERVKMEKSKEEERVKKEEERVKKEEERVKKEQAKKEKMAKKEQEKKERQLKEQQQKEKQLKEQQLKELQLKEENEKKELIKKMQIEKSEKLAELSKKVEIEKEMLKKEPELKTESKMKDIETKPVVKKMPRDTETQMRKIKNSGDRLTEGGLNIGAVNSSAESSVEISAALIDSEKETRHNDSRENVDATAKPSSSKNQESLDLSYVAATEASNATDSAVKSIVDDKSSARDMQRANEIDTKDRLERRRTVWTKECSSWSKSSRQSKGETANRRRPAVRIPASAKSLQPLAEHHILTAANVASLQQVTTLELHDLPGCALRTLSQCVCLKSLVMNNCKLVTTEGLERLASLKYVDLKGNNLESFNFCDVVNLQYLDISHNSLTSIDALAGCTSLLLLNASHNKITRIAGLETLHSLHTFNISNNLLISSANIGQAMSLQDVNLSHNHLQVLEGFTGQLGLLHRLNVSSNSLVAAPVLSNQILLTDLLLDDNSIMSLSGLAQSWLPRLQHLGLKQNSLTSLDDLLYCGVTLESIDLSDNQISEVLDLLRGLSHCPRLRALDICRNPLTEETDYILMISSTLTSLCTIDGERVNVQTTDREEVNLDGSSSSKDSTVNDYDWSVICLKQISKEKKLHENYMKSLQNCQSPVEKVQKFAHYFHSSHEMAVQHRLVHEYSNSIQPHPPTPPTVLSKPATTAADQKYSTSVRPIAEVHADSAALKAETKSKFELAFARGSRTLSDSSTVAKENGESSKDKFNAMLLLKTAESKNSTGNRVYSNELRPVEKTIPETLSSASTANNSQRNMDKNSTNDRNVAKDSVGFIGRSQLIALTNNELRINAVRAAWTEDASISAEKYCRQDAKVLNRAAIKIQAVWKGYHVRQRLAQALKYSRLHRLDERAGGERRGGGGGDVGDIDFDDPNLEVDIDSFIRNEAQFCQEWVISDASGNGAENLYATQTKQAWKGSDASTYRSGVVDVIGVKTNIKPPPHPPSHLPASSSLYQSDQMSGSDFGPTQRLTGLSKKEEIISEEWGFKDARTAELLLLRARKLEHAARKKRYNELDPKQRLAMFQKLDETAGSNRFKPTLVQTKRPPRVDYFQANASDHHEEMKERLSSAERRQQQSYTFEWIHTQIKQRDSSNTTDHSDSHERTGSERSLPRIDPTFLSGGRATIAVRGRPRSVELAYSENSTRVTESPSQHRKLSINSDKLPPLHPVVNAPAKVLGENARSEKLSWRTSEVNTSSGWGGGKKRDQKR